MLLCQFYKTLEYLLMGLIVILAKYSLVSTISLKIATVTAPKTRKWVTMYVVYCQQW